MHDDDTVTRDEPAGIVTRSDAPGNWPSARPLVLLALLGLMLLHACMPR